MGKKKKIAVNAIDKYIKQIKYRTEFKKPEKAIIRQPKVVISRLRWRRLKDFIDPSKPERNEKETFNNNVPTEKISRKRKIEASEPDVLTLAKVNSVSNDLSREKKIRTAKPGNSALDSNQTKETSNKLKKNQKKRIKTALPSAIGTVDKETAEKSKQTFQAGQNVKERIKKPRCRTRCIVKAGIVKRKNSAEATKNISKSRRNSTSLQNYGNVLIAVEETISRNQNIPTDREDISQTGESSQPNLVSNEPCLCEPLNCGVYDFSEQNAVIRESLIPNKYRSCVEKLKSLTAESIKKFVNDNHEYYIDLRKADLARKMTSYGRKKQKNELKDSFKCNPFDSAQQLAMYVALREIFQIPASSFMECRYFFTLLIPEICCQLFAQIFKVKTSSAPRLIKKLYSEPVCPV